MIASFFYIGALNEAAGHGNRVARFISNTDAISRKVGSEDARILKGAPDVAGPQEYSHASLSVDSQGTLPVVAEFSHVTVKNPANVTLGQDLNLKASIEVQLKIA